MAANSMKAKTLITVVKGIIAKDDINENYVYQQIDSFLSVTPLYVKLFVVFSIAYCNMLSVLKNKKMIYSLHVNKVAVLLNNCEKHFIGRSIVMLFKLISTLVYFDDDKHAECIGYKHLDHCK
ncbi:MAG: hypothetical protein WBK20_01535 [Spirochaetota bacterium]